VRPLLGAVGHKARVCCQNRSRGSIAGVIGGPERLSHSDFGLRSTRAAGACNCVT
jgi:hypothetical protein